MTLAGAAPRRLLRSMPIGAEVQPEGGVHFRVWAPRARRVRLMLDGESHTAQNEAQGYWSAFMPQARAGARYGFCLDEEKRVYPDPASRFQPDGPHRLSCVIDHSRWTWEDGGWPGLQLQGQVICELHVGTFTREGTWR